MNAKALSDQHAAVLIADSDAGEKIPVEVLRLVKDEKARLALGAAIKDFAKPDATRAIVEEINKLIQN